jgi:iron(III) transport system substrate-binding protein
MRWTRRKLGLIAAAVLVVIAGLGVAAFALAGSADVVVYNGRSHYGDEAAYAAFEEQTGLDVELRGGTAPELFERLRREGENTDADLLVTTDLANLWRAKEAGVLEPVELDSDVLLRDPEGAWWGISSRLRVPMRSTERVEEDAVKGYQDLGNRDFRGRVCLRTSNNEYNQSWVADRIAKFGEAETEALLERIMANEPQILGSDVDVLEAIAAGDCDLGLTNHYYLARELEEDPDFPVAPAWPAEGGTHTNVSGVGLVKGAGEQRANAIRLMEFLTAREAQEAIAANGEFAADPDVPPAEHISDWAGVELDPIDVEQAGPLLADAVEMMQRVGWK